MSARSKVVSGVFAVVAAAVVTVILRLSKSELMLLVGLACGLLSGLPTLVLVFVAWRRSERRQQEWEAYRLPDRSSQSPVVIVPPMVAGQLPYHQGWDEAGDLARLPASRREFTVIGEEE